MDILKHLRQPGWEFKLGSKTLVIDAPDEFAANELIEAAFDQLALAASKLQFKNVEIRWSGAIRPIRVLASMVEGELPEVSDMVFARGLGFDAQEFKILERMRESEKPMSICDLESDNQEWVNVPLTQMLQMTSDEACEQNMKDYWEEDALAYVKRMLQQQGIFDHSYEAMLPYTRAQFSSTFEVIEFGHPKRLKRLVTIHSYEPVRSRTMV
jgi:hypothetical protein